MASIKSLTVTMNWCPLMSEPLSQRTVSVHYDRNAWRFAPESRAPSGLLLLPIRPPDTPVAKTSIGFSRGPHWREARTLGLGKRGCAVGQTPLEQVFAA
jgi:hypothetical protein